MTHALVPPQTLPPRPAAPQPKQVRARALGWDQGRPSRDHLKGQTLRPSWVRWHLLPEKSQRGRGRKQLSHRRLGEGASFSGGPPVVLLVGGGIASSLWIFVSLLPLFKHPVN